MLKLSTPTPGTLITNQMHTNIRHDLCTALEELEAAETYASLPARIRLDDLAPGNKSWTPR